MEEETKPKRTFILPNVIEVEFVRLRLVDDDFINDIEAEVLDFPAYEAHDDAS